MTFRASNLIPQRGYDQAKSNALQVRDYSLSRSARFTQTVNADVVLETFHDLRRFRDELDEARTVPGIVNYAKVQEADTTYEVAAEFNAVIAAIETTMANIESTFPQDGEGYLLEKQFNAQGTYDFRQFTAANLTTLRGLLDAIAATIS